jgi:AbrB family looped-hinge helix DNA binding protein
MRRTIINARGQVTIPVELRKQLEIKSGTRVNWTEEQSRLVLTPMTARRIKEIRGFLKPKPGEPSAFEELFRERERERRREDSKLASYDRKFEKKRARAGKLMKRYRYTLSALAK